MSAKFLIRGFNGLRAAREHLERQIEADVDTPSATAGEARTLLAEADRRLTELEPQVRALPGTAYLFKDGRSRTGRTRVLMPQSPNTSNTTPKEGHTMASKKQVTQLEETLVALRKAEKSAGTTKWALEGAGAKKNPPTPERKKALSVKLKKEQALVKALRAERDERRAAA